MQVQPFCVIHAELKNAIWAHLFNQMWGQLLKPCTFICKLIDLNNISQCYSYNLSKLTKFLYKLNFELANDIVDIALL